MSKAILEMEAKERSQKLGSATSRRLRRLQDLVPAVVYGGNEKPQAITVAHNSLLKAMEHEVFYSHILTLKVGNQIQKVVLKDVQRHPYKPKVLHLDFQRVDDNKVITMKVPLHFIDEDKCIGVKQGGVISHHMIDIEVRCKAKYLPEFILVNLAKLNIDSVLHVSELKIDDNIDLPILKHGKSQDLPIVSVHMPKVKATDEADQNKEDGNEETSGSSASDPATK